MKKKGFKTIAITAVTGCLLLSFSMMAFASTGSGYETYKDAVKSTILAKNATVNAQFELKDNGAVISSGSALEKLDNQNSSSKTSITVGGVTQAFESSADNGNVITKSDDKYYSMNRGNQKNGRDMKENLSESSSTVKLAEVLTDTLVGNVKNQFVTNGQTISVNLEGAQIPELAKLAISAAAENSGKMKAHGIKDNQNQGEANMKGMLTSIPSLSNIDVKSIEMTATVDGNVLKNNEFTVELTGTDANGASHDMILKVNADISNVGSTKIDTIDTTGKTVTPINKAEQFRNKK